MINQLKWFTNAVDVNLLRYANCVEFALSVVYFNDKLDPNIYKKQFIF